MPELTIDATEAKSFEPIPDGIYDVRVREISEPKDGPNSTYVNVTFEIEDLSGDDNDIYLTLIGRMIMV